MDSKELRKLLKEVKFPQGQGLVLADDGRSATWSAQRGHAGGNAISRMAAALKAAGFTQVDRTLTTHAGGETTSSDVVWHRGDVTVRYHSHYGRTSRDNRFSASIAVNDCAQQG